ncbi:MAG: hypothetical protein IKB96_00535 [Prevotella sp.]|nr:hypothetical protein [Prevotella sp.]
MIVRDHGFNEFFAELDTLLGLEVAVGIDDPNVAWYAAINEFGTDTIPQRSFLRSTFDENQDNVISMYANRFNTTQSLLRAAEDTGDYLAMLVRAKIDNGNFTPNAPSTIRSKGSSRPLIDTGRMQGSIRSIIRGAR